MQRTQTLLVDGRTHTFAFDLVARRWTADHAFGEADFPLVVEIDGKRYEFYSDGTLDEEERS